MRGETGLHSSIAGAADGDLRAISCNDVQTACLLAQGNKVGIGNPVGTMHLQTRRMAEFFQRIGKTQQNQLLPARGDDLRVMILNR